MPSAYPLQWPNGRRRWNGPRQIGKFKVSEHVATEELFEALEKIGATNVVVSSNRQGFSRSKSNPDDPGIAVYFTRKGRDLCIACDKWQRLEHNLRAIGLNIEAIRSMERWGTDDMVDAAFSGYTALPESLVTPAPQEWWQVLEVPENADKTTIRAAYKAKVKFAHPDAGGNNYAFNRIQRAYEESGSA